MSVFNEPTARVCRVCKAEKPYKAFWKEAPNPSKDWWEPTEGPKAKGFEGRAFGARGYLAKACVTCREKDKKRKRVAAKANPRPKRTVPSRTMTAEEYEKAFGKPMPVELLNH